MTITKIHDDVTSSIRSLIGAINKSGRNQLLLSGGVELLRQTRSSFGGNGSYNEKSWPRLSKAYAKKVGHKNATLIGTGELKNSIKLGRPYGDSIEVFTRNKYAAAQAFGSKTTHLPARNYWPIQTLGGPSYSRLTLNSHKDLFNIITLKLTVLSNGSFPRQSNPSQRMQPSYGNPFK